MESTLDEDLERVASGLYDLDHLEVEMRTNDGCSDKFRAKSSLTVENLLLKNYGVSTSCAKLSTVYLGDMALEHGDTLEESGICDGARLTVDLAPQRIASHVVIDNGTWQNRMGFAGEDAACHMTEMKDTVSYEAMEKVWVESFKAIGVDPSQVVKVSDEDDDDEDESDISCGVLLTEASNNSKEDRERKTEIMFESFQVPNFCLQATSTLAMYATGRTTGTVIDLGYEHAKGILIYEGYNLPHTIQENRRFGGRTLSNGLQQAFGLPTGKSFWSPYWCGMGPAYSAFVEALKLNHGQVAPYARQGGIRPPGAGPRNTDVPLTLPDGSKIELGSAMFDTTEELFREPDSLQGLIRDVIYAGDCDVRGDMWANIVVHGGTAQLPGLKERLAEEVKAVFPMSANVNLIKAENNAAWIGGSIMAGLSSFSDRMWISKAEYDEFGPDIVHQKCFV
jgi:actin-related protein